MFGMTDISIDLLTNSPLWASVGLLGLLGLAVLLYWRTNPPLPKYLRILLGALRVVAVLALMAALFEPVLSYTLNLERPRRLAVVIDRSASMDREENGQTRAERVDSLLSGEAMARLIASTDISTYYFGGNLTENANEVRRQETALASALRELDRRQLSRQSDYWLLFSDGRTNSGPPPLEIARSLPTPVIPIGMASGGDGIDVTIAQVDYNAVVFVGQPTELKVKLQWNQAEGQTLQVFLRDSARQIGDTRYAIDQESGYADLVLRYVPDQPGQRLLDVDVPPLPGEVNQDNNTRAISVKALRSRVSVLVVTESPDYELGFLHRFLKQSDRYDVELIALGGKSGNLSGRFPDAQTELNRYDLVILHDPDPARLTAYQSQLRSFVSERGGGLWAMLGHRFASRAQTSWFNNLLPFYSGGPTDVFYAPFHGVPAEGQLFHPAVRLGDNRAQIRESWAGLPPFKVLVPCDRIATGGVVLAHADGTDAGEGRLPILGFRRLGPGKVLASAAQPFWTWGFESLGYGGDNSSYGRFMEGVVSWLTIQDDFDPIRILPNQDIFSRGEPIRFEGFAFDQGFRPIPDVDGSVVLTHAESGEQFEADLLDRGEGKHQAEFSSLPPGGYAYEASFSKDGQILKTNRGRLLVESFSLEEYDQQGDPVMLAALARATGGNFYDYKDFDQATSSLDLSPVVESLRREIVVWGKLWLLLVFVGALALEWFLRKRYQLI